MATVMVLTAVHINHSTVRRRLSRTGYELTHGSIGFRAARHGRWDAVDVTATRMVDVTDQVVESARALLGFRPNDGFTCSFDGPVLQSDAWPTVVEVARAVAASVPLAVLDDGVGNIYLVHPDRGLIGREAYEAVTGTASTGELLRRFMGNRI
jgi:hypothetical protein